MTKNRRHRSIAVAAALALSMALLAVGVVSAAGLPEGGESSAPPAVSGEPSALPTASEEPSAPPTASEEPSAPPAASQEPSAPPAASEEPSAPPQRRAAPQNRAANQAERNGIGYPTLAGALAEAQSGDTVRLLTAVPLDQAATLDGVTLDLNGQTLSSAGNALTLKGGAILKNGAVTSGGTAVTASGSASLEGVTVASTGQYALKISGGGTDFSAANCTFKITGSANYTYAISAGSAASVTLENCAVSNETTGKAYDTANITAAAITVTGGSFTSASASGNALTLSASDRASVTGATLTHSAGGVAVQVGWSSQGVITLGTGNTITGNARFAGTAASAPLYRVHITGGVFASAQPIAFTNQAATTEGLVTITGGQFADQSVQPYLAPGYFLTNDGGSYKAVGDPGAADAVAYIPATGVFYDTLAEALAAAGENQVALLADVQTGSLSGVIDGRGKQITFTGSLADLLATGATVSRADAVVSEGTVRNLSMASGLLTAGRPDSGALAAAGTRLAAGYLIDGDALGASEILPESAFLLQIGPMGYTTLAEGLYKAGRNDADGPVDDQAKLLKDAPDGYQEFFPGACYTLDLNGHTLGGPSAQAGFGVMQLTGQFASSAHDARITLKNGAVQGADYAVVTNGNLKNVGLTLTDLTLESASIGVYFPSYAGSRLEMTRCAVTAGTGVGVKGGSVLLTGCSVTATGAALEPEAPFPGGIHPTGDAVYLEGGYDRPADITIASGTYLSQHGRAVGLRFADAAPGAKTIAVNGGLFSSDVSAWVAEGLNLVKIDDGRYAVAEVEAPRVPPETLPSGAAVAVAPEAQQVLAQAAQQQLEAMLADPSVPEADKEQVRAALADGQSVTIVPVVTPLSQQQAGSDAQIILDGIQPGSAVLQYLDLSLQVQVGDRVIGAADRLAQPIRLTVTLDGSLLASGRSFAIARVHDGALTLLPTTLEGNVLSAMSDAYSTYAVVYTDAATPGPSQSADPTGSAQPSATPDPAGSAQPSATPVITPVSAAPSPSAAPVRTGDGQFDLLAAAAGLMIASLAALALVLLTRKARRA